MKTTRSEFSFRGSWPSPDVALLRAFIGGHPSHFMASDAYAVRVTRGGAVQEEVQIDGAEDWPAAITADVKAASISAYSGGRSFSIYWTLPRHVNVSAGGDDPDAALSLVTHAREALGLLAEEAPARVERAERMSLSGNYASSRAPDLAWLDDAVDVLRSFNDASVTAGYRLVAAPAIRRSGDLSALRELMQSNAALLEWSLTCGEAYLSCGRGNTITLNASSPSEPPLLAFDAEAQRRLALIAASDSVDEQTKGVSRRGFMRRHPDAAWFDSLVAELRRIIGAGGTITGRLRTVQNEDLSFRAVDVWRQALQTKWSDLAQAGLWCVGPTGSVNINVDLRRELVTSNFNLRSAVEVYAVAEQFNTACDLEPAPEDAYKYRKYGRSYRIREWIDNKHYGDAVEAAVRLAFDGMPVAVMSAFVEAGDATASLDSFTTVAAFVGWFSNERPFQNASLIVEGFQGRHLGIHVDRVAGSFRILGSLSGTLFDKVDERFDSAIMRSDKKDTGEKVSKASGELGKTFFTAIAALLVAVIGTAWNFVNASRESPELKVVYPPDKAELKANSVDVQWRYREPRIIGKPRWSGDQLAEISLLGEGHPPQSIGNGRGHAALKDIAPGIYTIVVSIPDGPTETRQVTIKPVDAAAVAQVLPPKHP